MSGQTEPAKLSTRLVGRSFVNPWFEYLLIGGGLSLIAAVILSQFPRLRTLMDFEEFLPYIFLLSNTAHLASSTVRLYTIPGSRTSFSFLTQGLPLFAFVCLGICVAMPEHFGEYLQGLYLTWSPYHYGAQAYGLCVMYSFRSGCQLAPKDKKLLWWVSMLPLAFLFFSGQGFSLRSLVAESFFTANVATILKWSSIGFGVLAFVAPLLLFVRIFRAKSGPMPLICPLMIIANATWFILLNSINAFIWATFFMAFSTFALSSSFT